MSNSTPPTPPEHEQVKEQAEAAPVEEPKAPEDRLLELKREAEDMLRAERLGDLPGWKQDSLPEWMTEKEALRLHSLWLDVQGRRHQERPDLYGPIRHHNGWNITLMLAYCVDKMLRVQEIREETDKLTDRRPSLRATRLATAIVSVCESLKEIYSMTGNRYGEPYFPPPEKYG